MKYEKLIGKLCELNGIYDSKLEVSKDDGCVFIYNEGQMVCMIDDEEQFGIDTMLASFYDMKMQLKDEVLHLAWLYASERIDTR